MIRLPDTVRACLFDMDGVLTDTASIHAEAWKRTFDEYLRERLGPDAEPFDVTRDYGRYVDGKPREDGVRDFLASRGIELPEGTPEDAPDADTIHGIGKRKNALVLKLIEERGVDVYDGSVRFVDAARAAGLKTAVVSSSANTELILESAGLADRFDARVDGVTLATEGIPGKPAPDSFLRAAELLGVTPGEAAVFEDALAGVAAGPRRRLRGDRRRRPPRPGRGAARARRRHRRQRPRGAARHEKPGPPPARAVGVRRARHRRSTACRRASRCSRSPTATSACAATSTRASRSARSGTYLNGFYESYPLQYGERGYGFAEDGQAVVNVPDGKIVRLQVEDEPLDIHRGNGRAPRAAARLPHRRAGARPALADRLRPRGQGAHPAARVAVAAQRRGDPLRGRGARPEGADRAAVQPPGQPRARRRGRRPAAAAATSTTRCAPSSRSMTRSGSCSGT